MQNKMRVTLLALALSISAYAASLNYWQLLQDGNANFLTGHLEYKDLNKLRTDYATHQNPPITILSCADSRVPPELIFHKAINDLFIVRVAGNVTDAFPLASIEYAAMPPRQWTKLIVVMGHSDCGAVKAAIDTTNPDLTPLGQLIRRIKTNIRPQRDWTEATKLNARQSAKYLMDASSIIHTAVCSGQLQIKPAYYDMTNGRVTELAPLPPAVPCR